MTINKFLYKTSMLYYEGIDSNKANESKKCNICHYWYFLDQGVKFQRDVCNR